MQITNEEIASAERILIPGKRFTSEHVKFIRNFNTCDIIACPGSGKTTSLLAKLIILSMRMPFNDGKGICVLTHTNIGIDEIKKKLGNKCDILFKHPNFFGTIQSFVDTFLAIPYFKLKTGRAPASIDNDKYIDLLNKLLFCYSKAIPEKDKKLINSYVIANSNRDYGYSTLEKIRFQRDGDDIYLIKGLNSQLLEIKKPRCGEYSDSEKEKIEDWIINKKNYILMMAGVLHYDDAYFLANEYLYEFPTIKTVLQNRFKYIFIDEMQDTAKHQNDLINAIFTNPNVVVQKIGDPNQAIFDFNPDEDDVWIPQNSIPISISQRFHNNIAKTLKTVCLCNNANLQTSAGDSNIPAYIITYTDETITGVIEKFCGLAKQHNIKNISDRKFKAIGWRGKDTEEPGKICLKSYFPAYFKSIQNKKSYFNNLISYLGKKHQSQLRTFSENIVEGIVRVLTLSKVRYNKNGFKLSFTRSTLMSYLEDNNYDFYILFRNKIATWAKRIFQSENEYDTVIYNEIKTFILNDISKHVQGFDASKSTVFLNGMHPELPNTSIVKNNIYSSERFPGVDVEISTVHAVKGETHAATLYLETHFYGQECESLKIIEQFTGTPYTPPKKSEDKRRKQCLKMAYVGMSRPTHLLCVAMHKDRIEKHLKGLDDAGWEIVEAEIKPSQSDSK